MIGLPFVFAVICLLATTARRSRSTRRAIYYCVIVWLAASFVGNALIGGAAVFLPEGQISFAVASRLIQAGLFDFDGHVTGAGWIALLVSTIVLLVGGHFATR